MPGLFCQANSVAGNTRSGRKIIVVARWTMFLKLVFQSYVEKTGGMFRSHENSIMQLISGNTTVSKPTSNPHG